MWETPETDILSSTLFFFLQIQLRPKLSYTYSAMFKLLLYHVCSDVCIFDWDSFAHCEAGFVYTGNRMYACLFLLVIDSVISNFMDLFFFFWGK